MTWQITLTELLQDDFVPERRDKTLQGLTEYVCPICGDVVGIISNGSVHPEEVLLKRDKCRNGHKVSWK